MLEKILLRNAVLYDEDEFSSSEDSVCSNFEHGEVSLWILRFKQQPTELSLSACMYGRPFIILTTMLGGPPLCAEVQRAFPDNWLRLRFG